MPPRRRPPKRNRKKRVPQTAKQFEAALALGSDATVLRGKLLLQFANPAIPGFVIAVNPSSFGVRSTALATIFSRYKFKYLRVKFMACNTATTVLNGGGVLGFYDDSSTTEGQAPTTASGVLEMRCSGSNMTGETVPTEFLWTPVDPLKWYATTAGSAGSDVRLVEPAVLYSSGLVGTTTVAFDCEIDYCIVFKGAVDTGTV